MFASVLEWARALVGALKDATAGWVAHDAPRAAAALAFYGLLSLAPTVTVGIAISEVFLPQGEARESLVEATRQRIGPRVARALDWLLDWDAGTGSGWLGLVTFLFGATVGFAQLQKALNDTWGVEPDPKRPVLVFARKRLLSFVMVALIGAFLLLLTLTSAFVAMVAAELELRGLHPARWIDVSDFLLGLLLTTIVIAAVFKILPDAEIPWRQVLVGSAVTALLLSLGRFGVSAYVSRAVIDQHDNVGGALLALLLSVYLSAMIFLLGAEITRVYAERSRGAGITPSSGGRSMSTDRHR